MAQVTDTAAGSAPLTGAAEGSLRPSRVGSDHPGTSSTCVLASTPWAGSLVVGNLIERSGVAGRPRAWFDPVRIPRLARRMSVPINEGQWSARYLEAVRREATHHGVCSISIMWRDHRSLVRLARGAVGSATGRAALDSEVVAEVFPNPRYIWIRVRDPRAQALRWHASQRLQTMPVTGGVADAPEPDFQAVRWLETITTRQDQGWETHFAIHAIEPAVVFYEDLVEHPGPVVGSALDQLGYQPGDRLGDSSYRPEEAERIAGLWYDPYRRVRSRLSTTVGVRAHGS